MSAPPVLHPKPGSFTYRGVTYFVEQIEGADTHTLPVRFVLHGLRGRRYLLLPATHRSDRPVPIAPITHLSRFRPTPFGGFWFTVEDGKVVIAAPDA